MNESEKIDREEAFNQFDKVCSELRTFQKLLLKSKVSGLKIVGIEKQVSDLIYSLKFYKDENLES